MIQFEIKNLHLSFGGLNALTGINLHIRKGETVSLIGPNGAGKTSIINCVCKCYHFSKGQIVFEGEDITQLNTHTVARRSISRTFQNLDLFEGMTVMENVKLGSHIHIRSGVLSHLLYYGRAYAEEKNLERLIREEILDVLGLMPYQDHLVGSLPYGLQKRVDFARALAARPKLLILDEPMAGMNQEESKEMTQHILNIKKSKDLTILLVEHDMEVVMNISDRVYVINFGVNIAEGSPDEVKKNEEVIKIYLGHEFDPFTWNA